LFGGAEYVWDDEYQAARNKVLAQSTCIGPTSTTSTLSLRNWQGERTGFVLAQYDHRGKKERAIYFLRKSLVEYESK